MGKEGFNATPGRGVQSTQRKEGRRGIIFNLKREATRRGGLKVTRKGFFRWPRPKGPAGRGVLPPVLVGGKKKKFQGEGRAKKE